MYEPKYKLNQRDAKRWHDLLVRHCLELPAKPGGKVKRHKKYPPLTREEKVEFEALDAKRSKKIESHPKVKASIRHSMRQMRKAEKILVKLKAIVRRLKYKVDRKRKRVYKKA